MNDEDIMKKAKRLGVPVIPKLPQPTTPTDPNPYVAVCGQCGRAVKHIEGYYCPEVYCPVQPKCV